MIEIREGKINEQNVADINEKDKLVTASQAVELYEERLIEIREGKINGLDVWIANADLDVQSVSYSSGIAVKKLAVYNEISPSESFSAGAPIYLSKKRKAASPEQITHYTVAGQTLEAIARIYGIQIKRLSKLNKEFDRTTPLRSGTLVYLHPRT